MVPIKVEGIVPHKFWWSFDNSERGPTLFRRLTRAPTSTARSRAGGNI
jgi:hypothetical protein